MQEIRPVILTHVFIAKWVHRTRIKLLETKIVAVEQLDIDCERVPAADDDICDTCVFQAVHHWVNQQLNIVLLLCIIRFVLKKHSSYLRGAARAPVISPFFFLSVVLSFSLITVYHIFLYTTFTKTARFEKISDIFGFCGMHNKHSAALWISPHA